MQRRRTFQWADPQQVAERGRRCAGLDFLRSILGRDVPQAAPVAEALSFALVEAERGRVVFELVPAEFHYNPLGTVHGGVLATVCDSAAGAAVHSTLPEGVAYTTLEIKTSFLRPVTEETGLLRCEGTVISAGSRVAVAEAKLLGPTGKLHAHATSTCLIMQL